MCEYIDFLTGLCKIKNTNCPFVYFCTKAQKYKVLNSIPKNCKIKQDIKIPKGSYKVCFERKGKLYIDINGNIEIVPNPFEDVPLYVKAYKLKDGSWRLKR